MVEWEFFTRKQIPPFLGNHRIRSKASPKITHQENRKKKGQQPNKRRKLELCNICLWWTTSNEVFNGSPGAMCSEDKTQHSLELLSVGPVVNSTNLPFSHQSSLHMTALNPAEVTASIMGWTLLPNASGSK